MKNNLKILDSLKIIKMNMTIILNYDQCKNLILGQRHAYESCLSVTISYE